MSEPTNVLFAYLVKFVLIVNRSKFGQWLQDIAI